MVAHGHGLRPTSIAGPKQCRTPGQALHRLAVHLQTIDAFLVAVLTPIAQTSPTMVSVGAILGQISGGQ